MPWIGAPRSMQTAQTLIHRPDQALRLVRLDVPFDSAAFDGIVGADPMLELHVVAARGDDQATAKALDSAHAYHVSSARDDLPAPWFVSAQLLARCEHLLVVSTYGAGYDTVDVPACTRAGVCVVNQAGSNAGAVAEHTIGLMLGLSKRIAESDRRLRRGERFTRQEIMGFDLQHRVLGLVGIGHTGSRVAQLGLALGMRVLAHDPLLDAGEIARRGAQPVTMRELLQLADVVSLHCPLDPSTAGMMDAKAFAAMKPGALFISTARGGIHDEVALFDALTSGHLAGAGLDVWAVEPPPPEHPLLGLDQVLASYHTAGVTRDARRQMATMAATQIVGLAHGTQPPRLVNPEVWPAFLERFEQVLGRRFNAECG